MRMKSQINGRSTIAEDRDFFCSELVAKGFKIIGVILDDQTSSTQFMPGSFADEGCHVLKLTPGTSLGADQVVMIDENT